MNHIKLARAGLIFAALLASHGSLLVRCEAKEFDWSELGVSLTNSKASLPNGSGAANNLRLLVSPQRRISKSGYEYEYTTNGTQPAGTGVQSEVTSYVLPGSASSYLAQSPSGPSHASHSAAYSALSASLASLKNRLNGRGVTLSSSLADQPGLYSNAAYGSSLLAGSDGSAAQHSGSVVGSAVSSAQQPTYLSVSSQQDPSSSLYSVPPNQTSDSNKTIVLAIPAKINFLTGSKQQQQQQQQQQQLQHPQQQHPQPQQLTVIQSPGSDQQSRPDAYASKQHLDSSVIDPSSHLSGDQGERQYVLVNSQGSPSAPDYHSHSVAASLSPSSVHTGQLYSSAAIYQPASAPVGSGPSGQSYLKYIPTYQQVAPAGVSIQQQQQQQQQQTIQKVYSVVAAEPQQAILSPATTYEQQAQLVEQQHQAAPTGQYNDCLDTCNSADPRWRKHTISKYKYCCSRSAQYDNSLIEHPSAEKVGDVSNKYAEDAYYSYLYRKSRAHRARRQRARYFGRHPATGSQNEEDRGYDSHGSSESSAPSGRSSGASRNQYQHEPSPYIRHYAKSRQNYPQHQAAPADQAEEVAPAASPKYLPKEPRTYRRGRAREFADAPAAAQGEQQQSGPSHPELNSEDIDSLPGYALSRGSSSSSSSASSGYGAGDYSVDSPSPYSAPESFRSHSSDDDDTQGRTYDDSFEAEPSKGTDSDYQADSADSSPDELMGEVEPATGYKYPTNNRRRKQQVKAAPRRKPASKHYKKNRKSRYNKIEHPSSQQLSNGTADYDSTQPSDGFSHHELSANNEEEQNSAAYLSAKDNSNENQETEKDSSAGKYKASLNETAVANLSKTTMHLKEILSLLEKKAQLRGNDSASNSYTASPSTSTPSPVTTTTSLYPLSSLFAPGSPYASALSGDYLTSESLGLKNPYRYETSLSSPLSSSLSLPSSYGSLSSDSFGSVLSAYSGHGYGLHSPKPSPLSTTNPHHHRRRRPNKSRYINSDLLLHKPHGLSQQIPPSIFQATAAKNRFLNQAYYPTLQHPYLYRGNSPAITNPYPYKNVHKNAYSSLFNGPVSSKLATTAAGLYSDESRLHGLTSGFDPLTNVASSLKPTSTMRLRPKPFVFQPQVLPIYSRHTILSPQLDVKA